MPSSLSYSSSLVEPNDTPNPSDTDTLAEPDKLGSVVGDVDVDAESEPEPEPERISIAGGGSINTPLYSCARQPHPPLTPADAEAYDHSYSDPRNQVHNL